MTAIPYMTGQFLLAMPGIGDPNFERAVIAMCAHDENGALGIGLGATIPTLTFHGLLAQLDIEPGVAPDHAVHRGGPVDPQRGFIIHSREWEGSDTIDVAGRWALSGSLDILRAIAGGTGPKNWLAALGYAGWDEGQLDAELTRHGWLNVEGDVDLLFAVSADDRWERGFAGAGIDLRLLANGAGRA